MPSFRSIVSAVDFSDQSRHALRWAAALAALHHSRLTILTAVDPLLAHAARTKFALDLAADTEQNLREFAATALPNTWPWIPSYEIKVLVGDAADVIRQGARRAHADLIVLGTQGLGGVRKFLLGSTTDRLLRSTRTAILAVPLADHGEPASESQHSPLFAKTILAATDFSTPANDAAAVAADLACAHAASLLLVHVVAPVTVPSQWRSYVGGVDEESMSRARTRLDEIAASMPTGSVLESVVEIGRPAETIAELATQRRAGLIVLGLVGQSYDPSARPGAIAYRVLCLSRTPVLVVPPQPDQS
jgi:nucleotide-binding universal stress UspA family protein